MQCFHVITTHSRRCNHTAVADAGVTHDRGVLLIMGLITKCGQGLTTRCENRRSVLSGRDLR